MQTSPGAEWLASRVGRGGGWCVWASVFVTKGEEHAWNRGELVSLVKKVTVTFWTNDNKGCRKGGETRHYHKVAPDENTNSPTAGKFRWVNNALQTREVRLLRIKESVRYKQEVTRKNRCKPMTVEKKKTSLHFYWYDKTERFYSECFLFCETKHSEWKLQTQKTVRLLSSLFSCYFQQGN